MYWHRVSLRNRNVFCVKAHLIVIIESGIPRAKKKKKDFNRTYDLRERFVFKYTVGVWGKNNIIGVFRFCSVLTISKCLWSGKKHSTLIFTTRFPIVCSVWGRFPIDHSVPPHNYYYFHSCTAIRHIILCQTRTHQTRRTNQ